MFHLAKKEAAGGGEVGVRYVGASAPIAMAEYIDMNMPSPYTSSFVFLFFFYLKTISIMSNSLNLNAVMCNMHAH